MRVAHHRDVLPREAGKGFQLGVFVQRLGGDADIGGAAQQAVHHIFGGALAQFDLHLGEELDEAQQYLRQRVAGLIMRGGDHQPALVLLLELLREALEIVGLVQQIVDDGHHLLASLGDADQSLATAHEDLDAQLGLQLLDLLADARLRGKQHIGHLGEIEIVLYCRAHIFELLEIHRNCALTRIARLAGGGNEMTPAATA